MICNICKIQMIKSHEGWWECALCGTIAMKDRASKPARTSWREEAAQQARQQVKDGAIVHLNALAIFTREEKKKKCCKQPPGNEEDQAWPILSRRPT